MRGIRKKLKLCQACRKGESQLDIYQAGILGGDPGQQDGRKASEQELDKAIIARSWLPSLPCAFPSVHVPSCSGHLSSECDLWSYREQMEELRLSF